MHTCDDQSMQEHNNDYKRLKLLEISESMIMIVRFTIVIVVDMIFDYE